MLSGVCPCTKDCYENKINAAILATSLILIITNMVLTILALQGQFTMADLRVIKAVIFGAITVISLATFVGTYKSNSSLVKVCLLVMGISYGVLCGLTAAGFGNIHPSTAIYSGFLFILPIAKAIEGDKEMRKAARQAPLSASGAELP